MPQALMGTRPLLVWQALNDSGIMNSAAVAEASHLSSKASEVVKEASHTVQGAMSTVLPIVPTINTCCLQ